MIRFIDRTSQAAATLGGFAIIGVAVMICVEVLLRGVFNISSGAATEISSYVLAVAAAWAFSYALMRRVHVRIDALIRVFPQRVVVWFDLLALIALSWLASMMLWYGAHVFWFSFRQQSTAMTPLQTPMWIPHGMWLLGLLFFFITCLTLVVTVVVLLVRRDLTAVNRLAGSFSVVDEAADEIKDARGREARERGAGS